VQAEGTRCLEDMFLQLKHKKYGGTIQHPSLTQLSVKYNLFKYFESYCEIKSKASTDPKLKHCGPFDDNEFVINTNARLETKSNLQVTESEPVSILSYRKYYGNCITLDNNYDSDIFGYFEELTECTLQRKLFETMRYTLM